MTTSLRSRFGRGPDPLRAGRAGPGRRPTRGAAAAAALLALAARTSAQLDDGPLGSLEDLMKTQVEITSAAKKPQDPWTAPGAIYVLTAEDIRRSGASHVAEALRLVPGLHVARQESFAWQIAARGFNGGFSNKMLVLIDGRSVYTPLFAGVYWDVQDLVIEDIDRIEVIRGPGGSVWGTNAVNGVINIITKRSKDTQGTLVSAIAGTEERSLTLRHGTTFGETGNYRVYAKTFTRDSTEYAGSQDVDDWWTHRAGWRMDWEPGVDQEATFQGDLYSGREDMVRGVSDPVSFITFPEIEERHSGGNALFRWTTDMSDSSSWTVQTWVDRTKREDVIFGETRETVDLEITNHWRPNDTHDVVWGIGQRTSKADFDNTLEQSVDPDPRTTNLFNVFLQDDIAVSDDVTLTLGNKFERNSYTGWELQPTLRGAWTPDEDTTVWGAISRAVRIPSTNERDMTARAFIIPDDGLTGYDSIVGFLPGDMDAERVYAFEAGVRAHVSDDVTVDFAAFYNDFDDLRTEEPAAPIVLNPSEVFFGTVPKNNGSGIVRGAELAVQIEASDDWEFEVQYTYVNMDLHKEAKSADTFFTTLDEDPPKNILNLISHHELADEWSLDAFLIYVDDIPTPDLDLDSYWRGDVRLSWQPDPATEYAFGLQNLFHDGETETGVNDVEAAAYIKATKRY